jgi:phosphoglucomutase/phosphomannomutase
MLLDQTRAGFAKLGLDETLARTALEALSVWAQEAPYAAYRPILEDLVARGRFAELFDCFWRLLPFGTGGRRGAVGVGPNRMNPVTVADAVQGHCQYLKLRFPGEDLLVVLAADVREYHDLRGVFQVPLGPLAGISSLDFCQQAAQVYAANGIRVLMPSAEERYLSTPELSFHIRRSGARGGLNMSASHNHPDDNGAKFYNHEGGQEVPPNDEEMVKIASAVTTVHRLPFQDAVDRGLVRFFSGADHQAFVDHNLSLARCPGLTHRASVMFSPLHGTGRRTVLPVLEAAGFPVSMPADQAEFSGRFPSVPYAAPNPELPSAMARVMEAAAAASACVAMATDPDADRLGLAARDHEGRFRPFNGNQIALLLLSHILEEDGAAGRLGPNAFVIKTEVTSDLIRIMAQQAKVRCVGHLLVGFKYIGDVLAGIHNQGRWRDLTAQDKDFLCGLEESHGVLCSSAIRDKDAAGGALLLAELASRCEARGETLWNRLNSIYRRFGYFGTGLRNVVMEGSAGVARIGAIQESLRANPPKEIGGLKVLAFHDRLDPAGVFGPLLSLTDRGSRDVLVFELENRTRLILRPSGTEPKNKTYIEMASEPFAPDTTDAQIEAQATQVGRAMEQVLDAFESLMLGRAGVRWPLFACRLSSMIPLDRKVAFLEQGIPEIEDMLATGELEKLAPTVQRVLGALGPRDLALAGFRAWMATLAPEFQRDLAKVLKNP